MLRSAGRRTNLVISRTVLHRRLPGRFLSTTAVDLAFDKYNAPEGNTNPPLVICHGLFGSKNNWRSLAKAFAQQFPVYTLDLRNHGSSPHAEPVDYSTMASDVIAFFEKHNLKGVSLLGHSMGGKVVASLALNPDLPDGVLGKLIIADIAPVASRHGLSKEFTAYAKTMLDIAGQKIKSRKDADAFLAKYEQDMTIRAFLLTNFISGTDNRPGRWRIPRFLMAQESLDALAAFPYTPETVAPYTGDTLLISGTKSDYINDRRLELTRQLFPRLQHQSLDAGHWVHAERPNEFRKSVTDFILGR